VLGHDLARPCELLRVGHAAQLRVDHAVVEADHRQVRLRDGEVLVVSLVRDDRPPALGVCAAGAAREVEALPVGRPDGPPHPQVEPVGLVEVSRGRLLRARAVERVEVEAG
jgi:hypothetical protein